MSRSDGLVRTPDGDLTHATDPTPAACTVPGCDGWHGEDALGRAIPCPVAKAATISSVAATRRRIRRWSTIGA